MIELWADYRVILSKVQTRRTAAGTGMTLWLRRALTRRSGASEDGGRLARVELQFVVGDTDRGLAVNEFE
jgi:hypothetical protein